MVIVQGKPTSDSRQSLIETAAELVNARSYRTVGVKEICHRAGVNKGSFYYFFPSKQALMLAALDQTWRAFRQGGLHDCFDGARPPLQRIDAMFRFAAAAHEAAKDRTGRVLGCPFGNLAAEASTLDEGIRERLEAIFREWAGLISGALDEAVRRGEVRCGLDPDDAAWGVLGCLQGALLMSKVANDARFVRAAGRELVAVLATPSEGEPDR